STSSWRRRSAATARRWSAPHACPWPARNERTYSPSSAAPSRRGPSRSPQGDAMSVSALKKGQVIDSHTGGGPTRVVIAGGPDLGTGSLAERRAVFRDRFDAFRSVVVNEPRGSDVIVGAILCQPVDPTCAAGVIFFNNVGVINMCGHGTLGVGVT